MKSEQVMLMDQHARLDPDRVIELAIELGIDLSDENTLIAFTHGLLNGVPNGSNIGKSALVEPSTHRMLR